MGYSSDVAAYNVQISNYNNQIAEKHQKRSTLENEIAQLESSLDFRGMNENDFFDKQYNVEDKTQNYLNKIDNTVIYAIADEISYKRQDIISVNAQILTLESLKTSLRMPQPSDYSDD